MHGRDVRVDPVATRLVADVDSFCVGGETALDEPHIVEQPIDIARKDAPCVRGGTWLRTTQRDRDGLAPFSSNDSMRCCERIGRAANRRSGSATP
jgi:hypothetical protein